MAAMEINNIIAQAKALGVCSKIVGSETIEQLIALFTTEQGLEFWEKSGFPTLDLLRKHKDAAAKLGVYVDAGDIELHGVQLAILVGNTNAKLSFDDMAEQRHNVIVMHGAKAQIIANQWAVVFVKDFGGKIQTIINDNAQVICM